MLEHPKKAQSPTEVLFLCHCRSRIDLRSRSATTRELETYRTGQVAPMGSLGCTLDVDDIYDAPTDCARDHGGADRWRRARAPEAGERSAGGHGDRGPGLPELAVAPGKHGSPRHGDLAPGTGFDEVADEHGKLDLNFMNKHALRAETAGAGE